MLIRTLLLALFFISSALSICAAESATDAVKSALVAPDKTMTIEKSVLPQPSTAMTMEDALKCVTISAEDWLDGDTYYIRYTFTNPTDVAGRLDDGIV